MRWLVVVIVLIVVVILWRSQVGSRLLSFERAPDGPQSGQLEGRVWRIDPDSRTIQITQRVFGIGATPVAVTDDTLVIVGSKEGGFGDLREGLRVRAAWDIRKDVRQARFVQVLDRPTSDATPVTAPVSRAPDRALSPATTIEPPRIRAPVPPVAEPRALRVAPPPQESPPAPTVKAPPPTRAPTVKAVPPPPAPVPPPRPPAVTAAPASETDTRDPGAVIDWLLNQGGRD